MDSPTYLWFALRLIMHTLIIKREVRLSFRRYPRSCKNLPDLIGTIFTTATAQAGRQMMGLSQKTCLMQLY